MVSVQLCQEQKDAVAQIVDWYVSGDPNPFVLKGPAGSGKTEVIKAAVAAVGLQPHQPQYNGFTGKSVSVMRHRGCPGAMTLDRLLYKHLPIIEDAPKLDRKGNPILDADGRPAMIHFRVFKRTLNMDSPLAKVPFAVWDECSLAPQSMLDDARKIGGRLILIGDPEQLDPVGKNKPKSLFDGLHTNVTLTEIHRQRQGSAITVVARQASQGIPLKYGKHGDDVVKLKASELADLVDNQSQPDWMFIAGKNDTRKAINRRLKDRYGFAGMDFPGKPGAKIMCRHNNHDSGFYNGEIFETTSGILSEDDHCFTVNIRREGDNAQFDDVMISKKHFLEKDERTSDGKKEYTKHNEFTWGYCITGHTSQGSEWGTVVVVDDGLYLGSPPYGNPVQRNKWLYVAMSRASDMLYVVGNVPKGGGF